MRININDDCYIEIEGKVVLDAFGKNGKPISGEISRTLSESEIRSIIADPGTKDAIDNLISQVKIDAQQQ